MVMVVLLTFHTENWVVQQTWFKKLESDQKGTRSKHNPEKTQIHVVALQYTKRLTNKPKTKRTFFTSLTLKETDNPHAQAGFVLGSVYKILKRSSGGELWVLADEEFPAGLFEAIMTGAETKYDIKSRPFLPAEDASESELDVDVHKYPRKKIEREDVEFSFNLLDDDACVKSRCCRESAIGRCNC